MNSYRRGAVLGLTVAEVFILLTFLLLFAFLGYARQQDQADVINADGNPPSVWERPEDIESLTNEVQQARIAEKEAKQALSEVRQALAEARHELKETGGRLEFSELLRRKGEDPPCWYQIVPDGDGGKTRESARYAFNVAIYENHIELAQRTPPPGGAIDDGGGSYQDEWERLQVDRLPYGVALTDNEFNEAIENLVSAGRNREVRTYACKFFVQVWDKTPDGAKKRWKHAHDSIIEGSLGAYTVKDLEWPGSNAQASGDCAVENSLRIELGKYRDLVSMAGADISEIPLCDPTD